MHPLIQEIQTQHTPESLVEQLRGESGIALLRSSSFESPQARYSFVTAKPFRTFRSFGSRCEIISGQQPQIQFGNPWHLLNSLMSRYELLDEIDLPFPLGGCFGYWGYDLKNFTEPKLLRRAVNDLELPDCHVGFYDNLVVFDHRLGKVFIVSTGLNADGSRSEKRANEQMEFWQAKLQNEPSNRQPRHDVQCTMHDARCTSNFTRAEFLAVVKRAQRYIRAGDISEVEHRFARAVFRVSRMR